MRKNSLNNKIEDSVSLKEFFQGQINDVKTMFQSIHEDSYKQHLTRHNEIIDTIKDKTKDIPEMKNKTDKMFNDIYGDQVSGVTGIKKKVDETDKKLTWAHGLATGAWFAIVFICVGVVSFVINLKQLQRDFGEQQQAYAIQNNN